MLKDFRCPVLHNFSSLGFTCTDTAFSNPVAYEAWGAGALRLRESIEKRYIFTCKAVHPESVYL